MSSATTVCRAALAIVVFAACAAEPDGVRWDAPFGGSIHEPEEQEDDDDGPPSPVDSGDEPDDGPPKPTSETDGDDPIDTDAGTWGDIDETDGSSSSDDAGSSSSDAGDDIPPADSGMDADPGTQPAVGPWSSCEGTTCQVGEGCLQGQEQGAVCTVACSGFDPTSCPASPGDTVDPICISVMGQGVCALDCTGGLVCPTGMTCVVDNDDNGQIEVCL